MDDNDPTALAIEIVYYLIKGQHRHVLTCLALREGATVAPQKDAVAEELSVWIGERLMSYEIYWAVVHAYRDLGNPTGPAPSAAALCVRIADAFVPRAAEGLRELVRQFQLEGIDLTQIDSLGTRIDAVLGRASAEPVRV